MPPLKLGMSKHDVGFGRQMAGSLLFPPQITVWDSFLGLHPGFLLLFHPPAPQSIYISTHKYLSYQLISINLSLSKLALINFFLSTDLYQTYHDQTYIYELINLCQTYLYQTCLYQAFSVKITFIQLISTRLTSVKPSLPLSLSVSKTYL